MAQIRGNWGDGISLFSGIVSVRQHKDPRSRRDYQQEAPDDDITTDIRDVLAMKSSARLGWLQRALVLAGTGKLKASLLYDSIKHPKFVARGSSEFHAQLGELVEANLHLFSSRQQRTLLSVVEVSRPPTARRRRPIERSRGDSRDSRDSWSQRRHRSRSRRGGNDRRGHRIHSRCTARRQGREDTRVSTQQQMEAHMSEDLPPGHVSEASPARDVAARRRGHGDAAVLPSFLVLPPALPGPQAARAAPRARSPGPAEAEEREAAPAAAPDRLKQAAVVAAAVARAAAVAAQNLRMAAATAASAAETKALAGSAEADVERQRSTSRTKFAPGESSRNSSREDKKADQHPAGPAIAVPLAAAAAARSTEAKTADAGVRGMRAPTHSLAEDRGSKDPRDDRRAGLRGHTRRDSRARSRAGSFHDSNRHAEGRSHRRRDSRRRQGRSSPGQRRHRGGFNDAAAGGAEDSIDSRAANIGSQERPRADPSRSRKLHKEKSRACSSGWDDTVPGTKSAASTVALGVAPTQSTPLSAVPAAVTRPDISQQPVTTATVQVASPFYRFLKIPVSQVGPLIGPRGACITSIRQASGADIKVDQPGGKMYATIAISGKGVEMAEALILEKLAAVAGMTTIGGWK